MTSFDFHPSIRVLYERGCLADVGERARELGCRSALLVSDPGVAGAGIAGRAGEALAAAGLSVRVFSDVQANPTDADVSAGVEAARSAGDVDLIAAVGGGSAMDCAKGINFVLTNGGRMRDYHGFGKATRPMLPSIGVPTTAGTGSEAQSFALISDEETHAKMACGDRDARFRVVLLDPELVGSAPAEVKAAAGYDAVAHAVESYVCTRANPVSKMYAREAFRLLDGALEAFVSGDDDSADDVLLGAHLAGMSIECAMLGAAHACANPLTAAYDTPHGVAVGVMLPAVTAYNLEAASERYEGLGMTDPVRRLRETRASLGLAGGLGDLDVPRSDIPDLAVAAADQWTGTFNPRRIDRDVCRRLYESAY